VTADEDIRNLLAHGEYRNAFDLLLNRYQNKALRLAYAMLGDAHVCEDVIQDVFLQIWKALPSYRGEASPSTWIFAITRNHCLTWRAKMQTRRTLSTADPGVLAALEERCSAPPDGWSALDAAALVKQLPHQYREIVTLFYLEEKSHEEVAAMLGIPVGTVKTYLHRARKHLAKTVLRTI
jgi:RNA polymerase sigma-70 factor (ECF subfamily)